MFKHCICHAFGYVLVVFSTGGQWIPCDTRRTTRPQNRCDEIAEGSRREGVGEYGRRLDGGETGPKGRSAKGALDGGASAMNEGQICVPVVRPVVCPEV